MLRTSRTVEKTTVVVPISNSAQQSVKKNEILPDKQKIAYMFVTVTSPS